MKQCQSGSHDYRHFNNKSKTFTSADELKNKTGVCIKCGRLTSGTKEIKK